MFASFGLKRMAANFYWNVRVCCKDGEYAQEGCCGLLLVLCTDDRTSPEVDAI